MKSIPPPVALLEDWEVVADILEVVPELVVVLTTIGVPPRHQRRSENIVTGPQGLVGIPTHSVLKASH